MPPDEYFEKINELAEKRKSAGLEYDTARENLKSYFKGDDFKKQIKVIEDNVK